MSPQSAGSMGLGAPWPPGQGWPAQSPNAPAAPAAPYEPAAPGAQDPPEAPDEPEEPEEPEEPDPDWPDDWPDDGEPAAPGMSPPPGRAGAGGPRGRPRPLAIAAVAVAALAAGAAVALAVTRGPSSAPSSTTPGNPPAGAPSFTAPGGSSGNGGGGPIPGAGGTGGAAQMFIGGKVLAVSGTSITIGGPGRSVTAAVTGSTRVTGRVSGIQGVRTGDQVTAQITESGGRATATAIQDPAEMPSGGSLP